MSKKNVYLIAALLALVIILMIFLPKSSSQPPESLPSNGLTTSTPKILPEHTLPAPAPSTLVETPAPETGATAKDKSMDSDDVPSDAEVAPSPVPATPGAPAKPADDKGLALPPSEGQ